MKIKSIKIKNFIGIKEFNYNPSGKLNILKGKTGGGKSSVLEAIEKAFTYRQKNRTHKTWRRRSNYLYIETDTGLEIDRKLREGKADYFKLRQQGEGIKSTESELRKFIKVMFSDH